MTDKSESYSNSFNEEFCTQLEYKISKAFNNSKELKNLWCDGVSWAPYYNSDVNRNYLSIENVMERKQIKTTSWIGEDGQDEYEMTIKFGLIAIEKYQREDSLIDCIPNEESIDWISLDRENKRVEIKLK